MVRSGRKRELVVGGRGWRGAAPASHGADGGEFLS